MRSIRRVAPLIVGFALLLSATSVRADESRALDGETFGGQSPDTQRLFQATWGDAAAAHWLQEHNAGVSAMLALPETAAPASPTAQVFIQMTDHDTFAPAALGVTRGTTVTWHNYDTDPHTVTLDPAKGFPGVRVVVPAGAKPFDSGLVQSDQEASYTFDVAGHYIYICTVHAGKGMVATIDVA